MPTTGDRLAGSYRRLLLCYPREYRRSRGEELVGVLLDVAAPGRARPTARESANLIRHGLRCRLGRPASRTVVAWSILVAVIVGLFAAAAGTRLAWETARPLPDRTEAAGILAPILPEHRFGEIFTSRALFVVYEQPFGLNVLDDVLLGDGGEYQMGTAWTSATGTPPADEAHLLATVEQRMLATGWRVYPAQSQHAYDCVGPPCDPDEIPSLTTLVASRGDTIIELETNFTGDSDSYLYVQLHRATPAAVSPAGIVAGLAGGLLAWLVFGWASRRTAGPSRRRPMATLLFSTTMLLWWPPALVGIGALVAHQLGEPHPQLPPLWEWLGQPTFSLLFLLGCGSALHGLTLAALPQRHVHQAPAAAS